MSEKTQAFEKIFNEEKERWKDKHPMARYTAEEEIRKWICSLPDKTGSVWENTRLHLMKKAEKRGEYVYETIAVAFSQDTVTDVLKILR